MGVKARGLAPLPCRRLEQGGDERCEHHQDGDGCRHERRGIARRVVAVERTGANERHVGSVDDLGGIARRGSSTPGEAAVAVELEEVVRDAGARALLGVARQQVDRLAVELRHRAAVGLSGAGSSQTCTRKVVEGVRGWRSTASRRETTIRR